MQGNNALLYREPSLGRVKLAGDLNNEDPGDVSLWDGRIPSRTKSWGRGTGVGMSLLHLRTTAWCSRCRREVEQMEASVVMVRICDLSLDTMGNHQKTHSWGKKM